MKIQLMCALIIAASLHAGCVSIPPLMDAAGKGNIASVKSLLDKGADVNEWYYGSALTFASAQGHTEVVKLLIERGADVNAHSVGGNSALGGAARSGHVDIARILIKEGADIDMAIRGLESKAGECDGLFIKYPDSPIFLRAAAECRRGVKMLERLQNEYYPLLQKVQMVPTPSPNSQPIPVVGEKKTRTEHGDATQKLLDAKKLLDANVITKEEYDTIKAKLLPALL